MRLRSFALGVALVVAVSPVISVVCVLDCDRPSATSLACHSASTTREGATVRGIPHACSHVHLADPAALVTAATSRQQVVPSVVAASLYIVRASLALPATGPVFSMHDPPGLTAGSAKSLTTVLRI